MKLLDRLFGEDPKSHKHKKVSVEKSELVEDESPVQPPAERIVPSYVSPVPQARMDVFYAQAPEMAVGMLEPIQGVINRRPLFIGSENRSIVIGSDQECDVVIESSGVAGRHVRLDLDKDGEIYLVDLARIKPTSINEVEMDRGGCRELMDEDIVRLGDWVKFRFRDVRAFCAARTIRITPVPSTPDVDHSDRAPKEGAEMTNSEVQSLGQAFGAAAAEALRPLLNELTEALRANRVQLPTQQGGFPAVAEYEEPITPIVEPPTIRHYQLVDKEGNIRAEFDEPDQGRELTVGRFDRCNLEFGGVDAMAPDHAKIARADDDGSAVGIMKLHETVRGSTILLIHNGKRLGVGNLAPLSDGDRLIFGVDYDDGADAQRLALNVRVTTVPAPSPTAADEIVVEAPIEVLEARI